LRAFSAFVFFIDGKQLIVSKSVIGQISRSEPQLIFLDLARLTLVQTFFQSFRPDAVGSSFTTVRLNGGGDDQSDPGVEVRNALASFTQSTCRNS
jgi:hypothetical protein